MEKILLFQCQESEKIKKIADSLHIRVVEVEPSDYRKSIGVLAGEGKEMESEAFTGTLPNGSMMVFAGLTEKHLDKILASLRQGRISVDFKAVMTPSNKSWNVLKLYLELTREKMELESQRK